MTADAFDPEDYPTVGDWCYLEDADGFPVNVQPVQIVVIAPDPGGRYWAHFAAPTAPWPLEACQWTTDRPRPLTPAEQRAQFELLFEDWQDVREDAHVTGWSREERAG